MFVSKGQIFHFAGGVGNEDVVGEDEEDRNTSLAAMGTLAHHLHRLQNTKWPLGGPKWLTGSVKVSTPGFLGSPVNFHKTFFLI